jgi:hypothetical protein
MKYTEIDYINWTKPASITEEDKCNNALRMIGDAINDWDELRSKDIELIPQGSYENNTNVKTESDVDICVMLKDIFYTKYRQGVIKENYGFVDAIYSYGDFKSDVYKALVKKFGEQNVKCGNKSIKIHSNSYRVDADVVPALQYRDYSNDYLMYSQNYIEGIKFYSGKGEEAINFPKLHTENGTKKNKNTNYMYKKIVRIIKRLRYNMVDAGYTSAKNASSFVIECLIYNMPNQYLYNPIFTIRYTDVLNTTISYLIDATLNYKCENWKESNEINYLFRDTQRDINSYYAFFTDLKIYLEV